MGLSDFEIQKVIFESAFFGGHETQTNKSFQRSVCPQSWCYRDRKKATDNLIQCFSIRC